MLEMSKASFSKASEDNCLRQIQDQKLKGGSKSRITQGKVKKENAKNKMDWND